MKKYLLPLLLVLALVVGAVLAVVFTAREADALEARMAGSWLRDGGEDWHLELKVTDGEMEYRFVSGQFPDMSETLYTYGFAAKNGASVQVEYPDTEGTRTISVTVTETEMTFSPAITSAEGSETWTRE